MDVEGLAVSKVAGMIGRCPRLKAYIATNDKTPFTDGYIDLYDVPRQSKADFQGRVAIQVKGRRLRLKRGVNPKHSIDRTDLLAFQKESGVLYFVVAIDVKSDRRTVLYALLSPFKIENILNSVPTAQKSVSVSLTELPKAPEEIQRLVTLALKTKDQNPAIGFDLVLLERLQSFTIHTASDVNFDGPITFAPDNMDFALVINTANGLSVPVNGELQILPEDYVVRRLDVEIGSGPVTYNGADVKRIDDETLEIVIADGLKLLLRIGDGKQSSRIYLTLANGLVKRLKTVEFVLSLLDRGSIEFNGEAWAFEIKEWDEDTELRRHLKALKELRDLLLHLAVDLNRVDMNELEEVQIRQLHYMYQGLMQDAELTDPAAQMGWTLQPLGSWHLLLLVLPGSAGDKWKISDPFSAEVRHQFQSELAQSPGHEPVPVTAYDLVAPEHLATVLNMRLDAIVGAYEAISDSESTYGLANQRVLALIAAADNSSVRRGELLDAAMLLNRWLESEQVEELHHRINRWQIAARQDDLSADDRREIRAFRRHLSGTAHSDADQFAVACAILLRENEEVEDLLGVFSEKALRLFQTWPIWALYRQQAAELT